MNLTRRGLLIGAAAGGGLLVAYSLMPRDYDNPITPGGGEYAFDAWIKIARDGVITVAVPQLEMGQGITTLLPQVVAMELGADWRQVAVEPAPVSGAYANLPLAAKWSALWQPLVPPLENDADDLLLRRWAQGERFTATADGTAMAAYEMPCRMAAAATRALLQMAAGDRWGVAWEECEAAGGFITHANDRLTFGELAEDAATLTPPDPPPLRSDPPRDPAMAAPGEIGARDIAVEDDVATIPVREVAFPRLDLPSKVDGSHIFAGDVRLPDMVYAAIRHGPRDQAELVGYDIDKLAGRSGLVGVVRGKRWLAVAATNWWAAEQALTAMAPRFSAENLVRSPRIDAALDDGVRRGSGEVLFATGNGDEGYTPDFALRYDVAPAVHATLETASVTAHLNNGRLELWLASQAPEAARKAAARALGLSLADVILYPMPAGGSFDRRLDHDHVIEAALIARELARPVQLVWSRVEEQLALNPRPPVAALVGAKLTQDGRIAAMRTRIAAPPAGHEFGRRLFGNQTTWSAIADVAGSSDPMVVEGYAGIYAIPDQTLYHIPVEIPLPAGRLRGNAHGYTCFIRECFIDEVAHRGDHEPMSFRIAMLGHEPLLVACLQRAAQLAAWDGGISGSAQGIACHQMQLGTVTGRIAVVATASVGDGGLRVSKLAAAVDIGRVINRDIALQQIEGGLIFGLGLAAGCATGYDEGRPTFTGLKDLQVPALADCPEITIDLIESDGESFDPGELGVAAVAPAIANALFAASGTRLRSLPLGLALAPPPAPASATPSAVSTAGPDAATGTGPDGQALPDAALPQPEVSL